MNKFKYEMHMHTSQSSACAHNTAEEMARMYKLQGYTGIVVTDHFFNGNTAVNRRLPWKEKVYAFMKGYESAKAEGDRIGLQVFFGFECSYTGTYLLSYCVGEDFLLNYEDIDKYAPEDFIDTVHENGGLIVHAHPFRKAEYIPKIVLFGKKVDAIEVNNYSHTDPSFDEKAFEYAKKLDLPMSGGSDAHWTDLEKIGGVELDYKARDIHDIIKEIKNKNVTLL